MDRHRLIQGYEALRAEVIDGTAELAHRSGLVLFGRGGMVAWMRKWSCVSPVESLEPSSGNENPSRTTFRHEELASFSAAKAEATLVLAGMVLANFF